MAFESQTANIAHSAYLWLNYLIRQLYMYIYIYIGLCDEGGGGRDLSDIRGLLTSALIKIFPFVYLLLVAGFAKT